MKTPRAEDLLRQAEALIERHAARDALYDRLEELYDQADAHTRPTNNANEDVGDGVQHVTMPYATNAVNLINDYASQMTLSVQAPAAEETKTAKLFADQVETWIRAWLGINDMASGHNTVAEAAWHGTMRDEVVIKTLFDESLVRKTNNGYEVVGAPVLLQVRDPRYCYFLRSATAITLAVESWQRLASEIRGLYPDALPEATHSDDELVDWVEVWTPTHRCYFAGGEPIPIRGRTVVPHGYGCVPYAVAQARSTPRTDPEKRVRPLLLGVENTARNLDTWFSILATAGWSSAASAWIVASEQYGQSGKQLDTAPGAINYFSRADSVQPLQRAPLPGDFFQLGNLLLQAFQAGTFPFAFFGQTSGNLAGYALNLLNQSGRRALLPVWSAVERAFEGAIRNALMILREKVAPLAGDRIPLVVRGVADGKGELARGQLYRKTLLLDVAKLGDDFDVVCELSDPLPSDDASNLRMAIEAAKSQVLSQETALAKFKVVDDPVREMERIAAERVFNQLAPMEAIKLAQQRGYIPTQLPIPAGWTIGPDGQLLPTSMAPQPQPNPAPQEQPGQPSAADLQALSGQAQSLPEMGQLAGEAPPMMPGMA